MEAWTIQESVMGHVRPFTIDDIPQVIDLNTRLFPGSAGLSVEDQRNRFTEICFHNPWNSGDIGSLVYEEQSGKVTGFLGVVPRELIFRGEAIRVAVGQHLMVDHATLASMQLFKAFMKGPQDFTMADMSVDITRRLWERLGGSTSHLYSIYWLFPLRPISFFFSVASGRRGSNGGTGNSVTRRVDDLIAHSRINPFHLSSSPYVPEDLTPELYVANIDRFTSDAELRPNYSAASINWLFTMLSRENRFGPLQKAAVRKAGGPIDGWYIYHAKEGGRGEVLQICATHESINGVVEHLFHDAWEHGCTEISGRLNPRFMKEFGEKHVLFFPGKNWMLISSYRPEILNAVFRGDAYLTRLDGDVWFF